MRDAQVFVLKMRAGHRAMLITASSQASGRVSIDSVTATATHASFYAQGLLHADRNDWSAGCNMDCAGIHTVRRVATVRRVTALRRVGRAE